MADSNRILVREALFPKRKPLVRKIPKEQRLWYQKPPVTMNRKLREAIMDVLPFDVDKEKADLILRAIFDKIVSAVEEKGAISIWGFGRFHKRLIKGHYHPCITNVNGKIVHLGKKWIPDHYKLAFLGSGSLRRFINEVQDGNTGSSEGT